MTEDEMVRQHHRLNGHEFEQTQGDSEGQGNLMSCKVKSELSQIRSDQSLSRVRPFVTP